MRDVVIPYDTMLYEIGKPPSKPWLESLTYFLAGVIVASGERTVASRCEAR
jgi:hypothetical protein